MDTQKFTPENGKLSDQCAWIVDQICDQISNNHWSRMQEHDVLYADPVCNVLYLGDAAHGMVPTLAQGATQAIEDACMAADHITKAFSRRQSFAPRMAERNFLGANGALALRHEVLGRCLRYDDGGCRNRNSVFAEK